MIIQDTEGSDCTEAGEYLILIDGDILTMTRIYDPVRVVVEPKES